MSELHQREVEDTLLHYLDRLLSDYMEDGQRLFKLEGVHPHNGDAMYEPLPDTNPMYTVVSAAFTLRSLLRTRQDLRARLKIRFPAVVSAAEPWKRPTALQMATRDYVAGKPAFFADGKEIDRTRFEAIAAAQHNERERLKNLS